ncbi:MAG: YDG domain-containing protein, partial [Christensenella sp.]
GSTLAANTTTISQNPLNKDVAEAKPIVKKKPGAVTPPVTPPPAADEAPVSGKIELAIIGAEAFPKPYDGTDIAYVTGVDFANLQNGDVLLRGTDYTLNAKFEDVNIGKNKKIIGTVALLPTEKTAKYNLKDGNLVNVAADITKGIPKNEFTDLVTGFYATVPYSASIDLSKFFKKGAGAGAESYEIAAQSTAKHSSGNAANLVVTKCGAFKVAFKTAATDKYDEHRIEFTLTVSKAPGTAIAEKLVGVKPTTIGGKDGKITGLDSKKLYEYKTVYATTPYTAVAANATEITGLGAGEYTVRYHGAGSDIKDEGIGTEITITNPKISKVSFAAMAQTETVLGKLVSALQSADTETVPDGNCSFKGELNEIVSWPEFDSTKTGYFVALQVNPQAGTAFTGAAELKLYNSGNGALNGTASLKTDNKIVLHVADALPNPNKEFKVTIDLDGAGTEYETTTYMLKTGGLTLAANNAVELT